MIKFKYTILYVRDVVKTVESMKKPLACNVNSSAPENVYAELLSGETTLSFASIELAGSNLSQGFLESDLKSKPFGIEIGFTTEDVEATVKQALEAGASIVEKPKTKPWGQVVAYVLDLDGFLVEICTEM